MQVHFADTTEPSVLAHEIITARPYAFLDDEEFQNRRTNAVTLRRGLAVDLAAIGALDPAAIEQVHGEITPEPESADDLADLLASLVVVRPAAGVAAAVRRARRARARAWCSGRATPTCGARPSAKTTPATRSPTTRTRSRQLLRGHLEISGITTVDRPRRGHHAHRRAG